ncbi:MAG: hypothetical protein QXE61_04375 [Nitrososphaerota archaeon]
MESFERGYFSRFLAVLSIIVLFSSFYLVKVQPEGYSLIYELPRAYPGSEWIDSRALYMKEDVDSLYFYVEFYGSMPTTLSDWERQVGVIIDSDKDPDTGDNYKGIGADYVVHVFVSGDASVVLAELFRWNETMKDFQVVKDLKPTSIIDPKLDYVEVKINKSDIGYTSRGFNFYVVTTGEWCHSGIKPWLDEFPYIIDSITKNIKVDGEASDWSGVHPLITLGSSQDTPQHFSVSKIYVANDNENLYIRVDTFEKPRVTVDHGEVRRYLYFFIDNDNNDASGDAHYSGADTYVEVEFFSRQDKFNNISYYAYTGEKREWYEEWSLLSTSNSSSDFDEIFELRIPLAYLNAASGRQINIFIPWGLCQILDRTMGEKEALSYPPITITTTSHLTTTTTQTYSTQSISTISTEKTTTTPAQLFKVRDLKIYPDVVKVGEKTIISINVENSGTVRGSYEVILRANGTIVNSKTITLEPGQLIKVEFNYFPGREGIYYIEVNGLTGVLKTVKEREYGNAILYVLMVMPLIMALLVLALVISRRGKRIPPPPP